MIKTKVSEDLGLFTITGAVIVAFRVSFEVGTQVSNFSIQYYNGSKYPIQPTILVIIMEFMKLLATIVRLGGQLPHLDYVTVRQSFRFLVPSFLYALNNNIYLVGLTMVTPPIWIILCSVRTFFTANVYKV